MAENKNPEYGQMAEMLKIAYVNTNCIPVSGEAVDHLFTIRQILSQTADVLAKMQKETEEKQEGEKDASA